MRPATARRGRAAGLAIAALLVANGPCGPIPGGALEGELVREPVSDWSFSDAHARCNVEVRPAAPHSVTTSCFAWEDALYVPAMMGDSKRWTHMALADPHARVRIGERIYPVEIVRVDDPDERRAASRAGYRKYHDGRTPPAGWEVPDDRWVFRLTSRPPDGDAPEEP